ncbi:MAG: hypothetical protein K2H47_12630 [Muribaculaceae bacterium]|nr:hypothetical protein [Muribaculaceae bacterium]
MKSIFSHQLLGAAVVAMAMGTATASAAEMIEMGGPVQVNVEYEVPAINGLNFYFDAPESGEAQYWLSTVFTPYYDADFTEEVPNQHYSYDHIGTNVIKVEAGERIYFNDVWGWGASQAGGQMFKICMNEDLEITQVNPTAGSQLSIAGYPMVDIWFNQAAKADSATISANGKSANVPVPSVPNSYISIDYTNVFSTWYADGTLKGGETVTFTYEGLQTNDGKLYNGDGKYEVEYIAAPEPLVLVNVEMGDSFKSFYLPGDAEGILTFHFNGEMGSGIMTIGYGNKETETGDYYVETIKGVVKGDTVSFDLTGVQRRPQDMLPSGNFYSIVEIDVSFTDAAGQPVYSGGMGTIGSFSYHLTYDYVEPVVYAPSFIPEPGSQLTQDTIEIEMSNYDKLTYSGVDFTVKDQTYNVPLADIIVNTNGNITTLTVPVPEAVRNTNERVVVTFSDISSADGADHSADFRVTYNGFTLTSFELYNPEGNVISERSLTELAADDVIHVTTNIESEELYMEYQIMDVTTEECVKAISFMVRAADQFGDPVYQATLPQTVKLTMGHEYHIEFFAYTDEMSRNYGADPIGEEYVVFYGLTPPFVYSSVQFVGADPANGTEIAATQTEFIVEFDGLVNIVEDRSFINYGMGITVPFESIVPVEPEEGYANKWIITIPETYISNYNVTELELIVAAVDMNGNVVEGTRGEEEYSVIELIYPVAAAPFDDYTVTPANNSVVEDLSVIEIYSENYPVSLNWNMGGTDIEIYTRQGVLSGVIPFDNIEIVDIPKPGVEIPDDASIFDDRYYTTKAVLTLAEPITEAGFYNVRIPAGIFTFGTQFTTYSISETILAYEIAGEVEPSDVDITPSAGVVEELSGFTLNGWLQPSWNVNVGTLTLPNGEVVDILADNFVELWADPNDMWSDIIGQSYDLGTTYTEIGSYVLVIPEGMFNIGETGASQNPEWKVIWTIGKVGVSSVFGDVDSFDVYTINGITVLKGGNAAQLDELPGGMYIINGQKVILKK